MNSENINDGEGEWITVTNKRKSKKKQNSSNDNDNVNIGRPKDRTKTFDKSKVKLWYNDTTWQHKVLMNLYKHDDNSYVLDNLDLSNFHDKYLKAETNYDKNYLCKKMMRVLTEEKWKEVQTQVQEVVVEPVPVVELVQEPVQEIVQEQDSKPIEVSVPVTSTRKEGISYASIV